MSQHPSVTDPTPLPTAHSAEPLPFASAAEMERAETSLDEPEVTTGIFRSLHTPHALLGRTFTLRQVVSPYSWFFALPPGLRRPSP